MHPDLGHLIELQRIESDSEAARRTIETMPGRREAIEARIAEQSARVDAARERLAGNQTARRALEKDLAVLQGRLGKFKDQLMEVKTNREYQAMQHEIATAQEEVKRAEDRLLELMIETDELGAAVKLAETELAGSRVAGERDLKALDVEAARLETSVAEASVRRATVSAALSAEALAMFEFIRARRAIAVAEARDGHCTVCHVRLRPQVFNEIRLNESLIKCDSCGRILYFVPPATPSAAAASST